MTADLPDVYANVPDGSRTLSKNINDEWSISFDDCAVTDAGWQCTISREQHAYLRDTMEPNVATILGAAAAEYNTSGSKEVIVGTAAVVCDPNQGSCGDDEEPLECDPNVEECTPEVCDPNVEECECDPDVEECAPEVCDLDDADCECDPDLEDCENPDSATTLATCATLGALSLFI